MTARCRSCGARVRFALVRSGKRAPFDAAPSPLGTVYLRRENVTTQRGGIVRSLPADVAHAACWECQHAATDHTETACTITLSNSRACECTASEPKFLSHFATCPNAHAWRADEKRKPDGHV